MNAIARRLTAGLLAALTVPALALPFAAAEPPGGPGGPGDDDGPVGPTPKVVVEVPATASGWYADHVDVTIDVSTVDELDPSGWTLVNGGQLVETGTLESGTNHIDVAHEGTSKLSYDVNGSGGGHREGSVTVKVDATDATVTFGRSDQLSLPVGAEQLVDFGCADALSGVASCVSDRGGSPAYLDTSTRGRHALTVTATDAAGNVSTKAYEYDVIASDTTAPSLQDPVTSGQQGASGWWTTPVGFRFTATDPVVDHETRTGVHHLDVDLDGEVSSEQTERRDVLVGEGRHVLKWAAADNAGNASGIESREVNVDTIRPTVTVVYPTPGQHLTPASRPVPTFECADAGSGSAVCGVVGQDGEVGSGIPQLDLTPGAHTFTARGVDVAGWVTETQVSYVVDAPHPVVRSATTLSKVKASHTRRGTAVVTIAAGYAPRGKVVVLDGKRRIATVTVPAKAAHAGRTAVVVHLPKLSRGRHVLRATYTGAPDIRGSVSRPVVVRVR